MIADLKNQRIVVILGGLSKEREVSLRSGEAVFTALKGLGYHVSKFDPKYEKLEGLRKNADVAFNILHGKFGEDGCMQGFLEMHAIPYTGSGILSSALCNDKIRAKIVASEHGIKTPQSWTHVGGNLALFIADTAFSFPVVVKPNREGSTIGVTIVKDRAGLKAAIEIARTSCPEVMVEQYIAGTEVTVGLINGRALPSIEIVPKTGFYDYTCKYTPGMTEYIVPARLNAEVLQRLAVGSEVAYKALMCRGAPRADYIIDKDGEIYFLEMNTLPGMTETSLLPKAARAAGMDFAALCAEILRCATLDYAV